MRNHILALIYKEASLIERKKAAEESLRYYREVSGTVCTVSHPCNGLFCPACMASRLSRLYVCIQEAPAGWFYGRYTGTYDLDDPELEYGRKRMIEQCDQHGLSLVGWSSFPSVVSNGVLGTVDCCNNDRPASGYVGVWRSPKRLDPATVQSLQRQRVTQRSDQQTTVTVDCIELRSRDAAWSFVEETVNWNLEEWGPMVQELVDGYYAIPRARGRFSDNSHI